MALPTVNLQGPAILQLDIPAVLSRQQVEAIGSCGRKPEVCAMRSDSTQYSTVTATKPLIVSVVLPKRWWFANHAYEVASIVVTYP